MPDLNTSRDAIRQATLQPEAPLVEQLVHAAKLTETTRAAVSDSAADLVRKVRDHGKVSTIEAFLAEFELSTDEGVALMCLAEAMLRVPDHETVDALIRDKISPHDWAAHIGDSGSIMVNASTWGLLLTGRILDEDGPGVVGTLRALVRRVGEPVIRRAVGQAMAEMGSQFVLGRDIGEALKRGVEMIERGYSYSYDMLGEAARTEADALRYHASYAQAIDAIAATALTGDIRENPGISVKLSALHPRYEQGQRETMLPVLCARLLDLAQAARAAHIGFNIDAEEADRLDISLDVITQVLSDSSLEGWDGFGVVVQSFGRRAMPVLDYLHDLAETLDRKIMVRLVKGAYWDTEIKRAQVLGLADYPVFTRKSHTDISYLACARKLLDMRARIYPQFATHNAHSVAAILHLAGNDREGFEFQRLHGMGDVLHEIVHGAEKTRCRIYAPVGAHQDLLAYLVRRLLENGANSSFVNQIIDLDIPAEDIATDPIAQAEADGFQPHPGIRAPRDLFAPRRNAAGWDITDPATLAEIAQARAIFDAPHTWSAAPRTLHPVPGKPRDMTNPAAPSETVGRVIETSAEFVTAVVADAQDAQPNWAGVGAAHRAAILRKAAGIYESHAHEIFALLAREAGKSLLDGVAELREAVDFLRYYAQEVERQGNLGPARGVIVCISPWNFPLAIFTGQIAAALAAGNAVIAKPAEQTPLIAARAVDWLHEAGVPVGALQLLPGDGGAVGAPLTADPRIAGVCFTGSTDVARIIDHQLAQSAPEAMLIAETGGLNAMIVDSTALPEQATRDIIRSAFQSAGQRCSALRVLYVQKDIADDLLSMVQGAMDALSLGDPRDIATDVGPVIDTQARDMILTYLDAAEAEGRLLKRLDVPSEGLFVPPAILRVNGIEDIDREIFGPVLHVATFEGEEIDAVIGAINDKGYGLTFGLHSRIDRRVQDVIDQIHVGNIYVNRDQIGAIVGSQPFGGHGLSGTGPKAGGPLYLAQFTRPDADGDAAPVALAGPLTSAAEIAPKLDRLAPPAARDHAGRIQKIRTALRGAASDAVAQAAALEMGPIDLPGPTGEANQWALAPRGLVLCLGPGDGDLLGQVVQALAAGNRVVALAPNAVASLRLLRRAGLPLVAIDGQPMDDVFTDLPFDLVALRSDPQTLANVRRHLVKRAGPIVGVVTAALAPASYCVEHAICVDTTAAGGNASLLAGAEA